MVAGMRICNSASGDGPGGGPQVSARRQVEGDGHRRELSLVVDRERGGRLAKVSKGRQRHLCALAGDDVHALQGIRRELIAGSTSSTT